MRRSATRSPRTRSAAPRARRCSPAATATTTAWRATGRRAAATAGSTRPTPCRSGCAGAATPPPTSASTSTATARRGVPPGWSEWYGSVDPSTYLMWGYTLNENGTLKTYGSPASRTPRSTRPTSTARRRWTSSGAAPARGRRSTCRSRSSPLTPRPERPAGERPVRAPGAAAQGQVREQAAPPPALLQRGGRLRQARLHPQRPPHRADPDRHDHAPTSRRARRRCSSVDEAVRAIVGTAARHAASWPTRT